jgi:hypoxia up-regulated 1
MFIWRKLKPWIENFRAIGSLNLSKVAVKGVAEALDQNKGENIESKGIKAHFNFDESGLLQITSVEAVFEKNVTVIEQVV